MRIERRYLKRSVCLMVVPISFAVAARAIFFFHPERACAVAGDPFFFALWPQNLLLKDQLEASHFTLNEKCTFFAMHSMCVVGWFIWLAIKTIGEVMRKDRFFIPGFLKVFFITSAISILSIATPSFDDEKSLFSLSLSQSIEINILKIPTYYANISWYRIIIDKSLAYISSKASNIYCLEK